MKRSVQLYIEGYRLELFDDEQIQITSSIQNIQDLSKTYTDFSQGFTIPASSHNNAIFEHWYQSDVNPSSDPNLRKDGHIEIDLTTFRKGKIQLDGANLKNGKPESYMLTFYGEGVTLKDLFGEDLLSDLDYSGIGHELTSAEVINRITDGSNAYDVKYPLITSNRIWQYQSTSVNAPLPNYVTGTSTNNDIHTTSGAIFKEELFPALRVSKIFDLIEQKYGIEFLGAFLSDERFTKLFMWYKGKEVLQTASNSYDIDFINITAVSSPPMLDFVDLTNNTIHVTDVQGALNHEVKVVINSMTSLNETLLDVYQNGNLINTIPFSSPGTIIADTIPQTSGLDIYYSFKIRNYVPNTISISVEYDINYVVSGTILTQYAIVNCGTNIYTVLLNLASNAPTMKVDEFVKGIMLMYNMTIYSLNDNKFWLEPLDDWYSKGGVIDISEFTDVTSIDIQRMPLYKKISFKYQKSDALLNKYFAQSFNRNYGDTTYQYNYDGGEFTIDLPFENLLQSKFVGSNEVQLGYSLNSELAPYLPKPILFYQYDNQTTDFKFKNDGGGHTTITSYTPFGQDLYYNSSDVTINFAPEVSSLLNYPIQNTAFSMYYFSYLFNLYNLKQRLVNVKAILPTSLITGLQLNDRLMIRDKRYIINEMKSNLTTGDVDLQLVLDFRPIVNLSTPTPKVTAFGGDVQLPVLMPNNATQITLSSSFSDVAFSDNPIYEEKMVTITIGATEVELTLASEKSKVLATENQDQLTTEGVEARVVDVTFTTEYTNGTRTTETIYILQQ